MEPAAAHALLSRPKQTPLAMAFPSAAARQGLKRPLENPPDSL
jgi:hypothetical protein